MGEVEGQVSVNLENIFRGNAKIALGFCHIVLGGDWTFGSSAKVLREVAVGKQELNADLKKSFYQESSALEGLYLKGGEGVNYKHFVGIYVFNGRLLVLVSMFGGNALPCLFDVGSYGELSTERFNALTEKSAVLLDAKLGQCIWYNLYDLADVKSGV